MLLCGGQRIFPKIKPLYSKLKAQSSFICTVIAEVGLKQCNLFINHSRKDILSLLSTVEGVVIHKDNTYL